MVSRMDQQRRFSDGELLAAIRTKASLNDAIRRLYRDYFAMARGYIIKNSGQPADAEDIFQEVLVSFIDIVQQNKFREESSVRTFLYSLVRHTWLNELKKRGAISLRDEKYSLSAESLEADASRVMSRRESMNLLMKTIDRLGDSCKKILLAFYFEKQPVREILETLHYESEQAIRNKKYKCLKQLEQWVNDQPQLALDLKSILNYE